MRKFYLHAITWLIAFLFTSPVFLTAEGTRQLAPNPSDRVHLYSNVAQYGNFAQYNSSEVQRLNIHIADPSNEQIFLGFSQVVNSGHYPCEGNIVPAYFRIVDPNGTVVFPNRGSDAGQILTATTANITTKSQAMNGPNQIIGAGGYDAFVFDPIGFLAGDYYIEFSREESVAAPDRFVAIEWWDITVATKDAAPSAIDGRVFAKNWAFMSPSISCGTDPTFGWFDTPFNGSFYVYTDQLMVAKTDFDNGGFQAAAFNVFFNDFGTQNTGNVVEDRKSLFNVRTDEAQHRIFLNDPDINSYPSGVLGLYSLLPRFIACENGSGCVKAAITEPGQIDVLLDFDRTSGDFIFDRGTSDRILAFKVAPEPGESSPYLRCIPWDGKDGLGRQVNPETEVNALMMVRYAQGIFHFPIYDAEFFLNGFLPTTIRPVPDIGSPRRVYYNDSNIPFESGSGAITEETFNSCLAPCHSWNNRDFGNLNTINTWFFSREENEAEVTMEECPIKAIDDTTATLLNEMITIDILANDFGGVEINKDVLMVGNITPQNGSVVFDTQNGDLNYTPNFAFIGNDTFEYVMCLDIIPVNALCDTALVIVAVQPADNEDCKNGIDDDGDGLSDCEDPDCLPATPKGILRGEE